MPVKQRKQNAASSTQKYLKLAEIHDDVVTLRGGELRVILETSAVNFDLKSPEEQDGVISSYQGFLNSLSFPIQVVIRSRTLDINSYIERMKARAAENKDQIMKDQTYEYVDYITKLVEIADIMQKKFYVVVPFDPPTSGNQTFIERFISMVNPSDSVTAYRLRKQQFAKNVKALMGRANTIIGGLQSLGLEVKMLKTNELIDLFYNIYNPIIAMQEKIEDIDKLNFNKIETAKSEVDDEDLEDSSI